jgi:hypothetical protein
LTNQIRPVEVHGVMDGLALGTVVDHRSSYHGSSS